jgi:SAM-dependent methyltransferase
MMTNGNGGNGGYDPSHFHDLFLAEDRHFWFRGRNKVISAFAKQLVSRLSPGYRVLEMGCGDGNVLRFLEDACRNGTLIGMDLYIEGLRYARTRSSCHLVQGDVRDAAFGQNFHLIGMFDVLEHIPDDSRMLADIWKLLDDGGVLLLTVPAHRRLWSYFDEVSGHCRRYEIAELRSKLEQTAYDVEYLTEYMAIVYPLMWLGRKLRSKKRKMQPGDASRNLLQEEVQTIPILNGILSSVLSWEAKWLAKRRRLPFGASLLVVARKRVRKESVCDAIPNPV